MTTQPENKSIAKICKACKIAKTPDKFSKASMICKTCRNAQQRQMYATNTKHREHHRKYQNEKYANDPAHRARIKAGALRHAKDGRLPGMKNRHSMKRNVTDTEELKDD